MKFSKRPNPVQASNALVKKFIEICLEKKFLTEAQVNYVLEEQISRRYKMNTSFNLSVTWRQADNLLGCLEAEYNERCCREYSDDVNEHMLIVIQCLHDNLIDQLEKQGFFEV